MLKKEYELLVPFVKQPWKKYTFKEIKDLTNKSSDSYVYTILKKQVKEQILIEEKAGNVVLYKLNLSYPKSQLYIGFISEYIAWKEKHLPIQVINKILAKIPTPYFTFIITGSYAINKQKETSDLDIVIIVDDKQDPTHIKAQINYTCELSIPPAHPYIFRKSEFLEMLTNKEANYGKEIIKKNLILKGAEMYFQIIDEAIKNGFDDKDFGI